MKFFNENRLFILSIFISLIIHGILFTSFFFLKEKQKNKNEEKPIIISFVNNQKNTDTTSAQRKIPRKTKVETLSKSTKPPSPLPNVQQSKENIIQQPPKKIERKEEEVVKPPEKKEEKKVKTQHKPQKSAERKHHQEIKRPVIKKENPKIEKNIKKELEKEKKVEKKPEKKEEQKIKEPEKKEILEEKPVNKENINIPIKNEGKNLQIASQKKENKENKEIPKLPVPPPENNKAKEEKPPKELNISHLKGKDEIFQMGSENEKEDKTPAKNEDIMKYLYKVRDKLQENLAYPLMAKRLEIEGTVIVRFIINPDGSVYENTIKVVKSSGSNILDRQAIITVENSIPFDPTPNKKKIVVEIPVIFEIIRSYN
jgi:protein TonB